VWGTNWNVSTATSSRGPFRRPCRFHLYYYTYILCCDWTSNTLSCTPNLDHMPLTVCFYSFYLILSTHILQSLFLFHNWLTFTHTCNAFVLCTTAIHAIIHVLPLCDWTSNTLSCSPNVYADACNSMFYCIIILTDTMIQTCIQLVFAYQPQWLVIYWDMHFDFRFVPIIVFMHHCRS
jgi:hypothetical protein